MLDTAGPELQVVNKSEQPISLKVDATVTLTPDEGQESSSDVFPINFGGLYKAVKKGDTIFIGQYLFTGSETMSVWLEDTFKRSLEEFIQSEPIDDQG
ncbi:pyruvate kinase 2, cytosolic [Nicotiana attenuata]|uniref:Pyruvate kinase 2, cytosolic n=1 Tax=Nicotiana attenuata TaxID=49451 RepID=A0A314LDE2_NICAT|nr:pyruvate kinase 2, cytosolic [Nicotiana attenuata]